MASYFILPTKSPPKISHKREYYPPKCPIQTNFNLNTSILHCIITDAVIF